MFKDSKILKKFFIINLPASMSGIQPIQPELLYHQPVQLKVFHFTSLRLQRVSTLKFKMAATAHGARWSAQPKISGQDFQYWAYWSTGRLRTTIGWVWSELSHLLFDILKCCRLWPDKSAGWVHHRWDIDETAALGGSWSIILFIFIQNSVENNIIGILLDGFEKSKEKRSNKFVFVALVFSCKKDRIYVKTNKVL